MRKIFLITFCLFILKFSLAESPNETSNSMLLNKQSYTSTGAELNFNKNYQQFKYEVLNFESSSANNFSNLQRRRRKDDNLMLYVAGGLAVATATLILTNNPENFTSNSSTSVNLGIAIGGTVACGLLVTKHFIDKGR